MLNGTKYASLFVFTLALSLPATVTAQWDAPPPGEPPPGDVPPTAVAPEPPPAPPSLTEQPKPKKSGREKEEKKKRSQFGFSLGVPIFLDVPNEVVRPGAAIYFWGGLDIGFVMFGLFGGFQWTPVNLNKAGIAGLSGRTPLNRFFFGPEVRFQYPVGRFLPYLSSTFDVKWWNFRESGVVCSVWWCTTSSVYRFTPGYSGKAGLAVKLGDGPMHLDVAFKWSFTGEGDFFAQSRWWLEPVIGILVRR